MDLTGSDVLLSILLLKADSAEDSQADQTFLGWLLVAMTLPGYVAMVVMIVQDGRELVQEVEDELSDNVIEVTTNNPILEASADPKSSSLGIIACQVEDPNSSIPPAVGTL